MDITKKLLLITGLCLIVACENNVADNKSQAEVEVEGEVIDTSDSTCVEGDHDTDKDGVVDHTLECYENGVRKRKIFYATWRGLGEEIYADWYYYKSGFVHRKYQYYYHKTILDGVGVFYDNSDTVKIHINWSGGNKTVEFTYYSNGKYKTYIKYDEKGQPTTNYAGVQTPICYDEDTNFTTCDFNIHGCNDNDNTCVREDI